MSTRTRNLFTAAGLTAVALLLTAAPAGADPYTAYFDGLRTAVQTRYDLLPPDSAVEQFRERRDLTRVLAAISRPSDSVGSDVRLFVRIAPRLEASVEADPAIRIALTAAADSLATELAAARDALALRVADVLNNDLHARLTYLLDRVTTDLAGSLPVDPLSLRALVFSRVQKRLDAAERLLRKAESCRGRRGPLGRGYVASRVDGTVVESRRGGALFSFGETDLVTNVVVFGYESSRIPPTFRIEWATGMFAGVGPYEANESSGVFVSVDTGNGSSTSVQGNVLVTEHDPVTRTFAGRFDVILEDGRTVGSGRFRVCDYGRESVRLIQ